MLKIRLFCANGMSTSLLVKKMEEAANEKGKQVDIKAYPILDMERLIGEADVALLGPQVGYQLSKAKAEPDPADRHRIKYIMVDDLITNQLNYPDIQLHNPYQRQKTYNKACRIYNPFQPLPADSKIMSQGNHRNHQVGNLQIEQHAILMLCRIQSHNPCHCKTQDAYPLPPDLSLDTAR